MTAPFTDYRLSAQNVSADYRLTKIKETYDLLNINAAVNSYFYTEEVDNPKTIGRDDLVMWLDPSNRGMLSLDAAGFVINDAQGVAFRDKSSWGNNLALPVGAGGIVYDSARGMLSHAGGAIASGGNLSVLNTTTLEPAFHWTTPNSEFTYFIVIEETEFLAGAAATRGVAAFFYTNPATTTNHAILSASTNNQWVLAPANSMGTEVCHPNNNGFNFERRAILAFTYGTSGGLPFRDLYYNGMFCGRQVNQLGMSGRNREFIFGGYNLSATFQQYSGFTGEQCLFKRVLTREEIVKMSNYLNVKWNVYAPRQCDVFCVAGQSNAYGSNAAPGPNPPEMKAAGTQGGYFLDPQYWYTANETPIACFRPETTGLISFYLPGDTVAPTSVLAAPNAGSTTSMWSNFADEYFKRTGRYAVFVYTARAGTAMLASNQWNPESFRAGINNFWADVRNIVGPSQNKLTANGWDVKGLYLLWNQGEASLDKNNANYLQLFQNAIDLVLDDFGYSRFYFYTIANRQLTPEGFNYSYVGQRAYTFPRPDVHMIFDCSAFTYWGPYPASGNPVGNTYMVDANHYSRLGYAIAGSESGRQAAEIVNKYATLTIRDVVDITPVNTVYPPEDVRHWGAVGNGVANDTAAIQRAIDANATAVYIPEGVYRIINQLSCINKTNFKIVGDGAVLLATTPTGQDALLLFNNNTECRIENIRFAQTFTFSGGGNMLLNMSGCVGCTVSGCDFDAETVTIGASSAVNITAAAPVPGQLQFGNTLINCNISRAYIGVNIRGDSQNTSVQSCNISFCSGIGIQIYERAENSNICDCNITACNVGIRTIGGTRLTADASDKITIRGCSVKNIENIGIVLTAVKNWVSVIDCDLSANGSNTGQAWAFNPGNNPQPQAYKNKTALYLQGTQNVSVCDCTVSFSPYGIAWNGAPNTSITGCTFLNNTTAHIYENLVSRAQSGDTYVTSNINISGNTFNGPYTVTTDTRVKGKSIVFYTDAGVGATVGCTVDANEDNTGVSNFRFDTNLPNDATYVIDPNYKSIVIDLSTPTAVSPNPMRTLNLSTAMFGREFQLVCINSAYDPIVDREIAFTANYTGAELPNITCGGIQYTPNRYTIRAVGTYLFTPGQGLNDWTITNTATPVMSSNIGATSVNVTPAGVDHMIIFDTSVATPRTLIFDDLNFWNAAMVGTEFYFSGNSQIGSIIFTNNTAAGVPILYFEQSNINTIAFGINTTLSGSDLRHLYKAVYVYRGTTTPAWFIYKI
jgi:parallel beta-helix repeat protein